MRTVGEILKKARLEKRLALEEIEKILRIRKKYLLALEENAWEKLPALPYIKGFLRNYSAFLDLVPEEMVAIFRRQWRWQEKTGLLPEGVTNPLDKPLLHLTPQGATAFIVISSIVVFLSYLFFQYKAYVSPPNLTVNKPLEGEIASVGTVEVVGKADSDAVVSINNQKVALSQNGEFSANISLPPGVNTILIEAASKYGKKRTVTRTIQIQTNQ
jgi:cytoskeletal protein RodZ